MLNIPYTCYEKILVGQTSGSKRVLGCTQQLLEMLYYILKKQCNLINVYKIPSLRMIPGERCIMLKCCSSSAGERLCSLVHVFYEGKSDE